MTASHSTANCFSVLPLSFLPEEILYPFWKIQNNSLFGSNGLRRRWHIHCYFGPTKFIAKCKINSSVIFREKPHSDSGGQERGDKTDFTYCTSTTQYVLTSVHHGGYWQSGDCHSRQSITKCQKMKSVFLFHDIKVMMMYSGKKKKLWRFLNSMCSGTYASCTFALMWEFKIIVFPDNGVLHHLIRTDTLPTEPFLTLW